MTITFKPDLQLDFNTLLAATSSQAQVASGASQHYLMAASALSSSSNSSSAGLKRKHSSQLAIWDGQHLLLCELHQGTDPSQRRIDQSLNLRALMMYGSRGSSKQLEGKQQQQCQDAEQQRRALTCLQPLLLGNAEDACGDSSCAALIQSKSHPPAHSSATTPLCAFSELKAEDACTDEPALFSVKQARVLSAMWLQVRQHTTARTTASKPLTVYRVWL
jgi:hypothetical protein